MEIYPCSAYSKNKVRRLVQCMMPQLLVAVWFEAHRHDLCSEVTAVWPCFTLWCCIDFHICGESPHVFCILHPSALLRIDSGKFSKILSYTNNTAQNTFEAGCLSGLTEWRWHANSPNNCSICKTVISNMLIWHFGRGENEKIQRGKSVANLKNWVQMPVQKNVPAQDANFTVLEQPLSFYSMNFILENQTLICLFPHSSHLLFCFCFLSCSLSNTLCDRLIAGCFSQLFIFFFFFPQLELRVCLQIL